MPEQKIARIKEAIKGNFDQSSSHYQAFEDTHGFFRQLNENLLREMNLPDAAAVLDVGCGTGASSRQILEAVPGCRVWGIDISASMLAEARSRTGRSERLTFVLGDAARLEEHFDFLFDAVVYSASVFLLPDFRESLTQAHNLLKDGGVVGLTFMDGVYDEAGNNLFQLADRVAGEGVSLKKPVMLSDLRSFFGDLFISAKVWNVDFRLGEEALRQFFSVPAMSAGLFPGVEYDKRLLKVGRLFEYLPKTAHLFRWMLMVGRKRRQ